MIDPSKLLSRAAAAPKSASSAAPAPELGPAKILGKAAHAVLDRFGAIEQRLALASAVIGGAQPRIVRQDVTITKPEQLATLHDVAGVVGDVTIDAAITADDLKENLSSLSFVTGKLTIANASGLDSLAGLRRLESAGSLRLEKLPSLRSLEGLGSLTTVDKGLTIYGLRTIKNLGGLDALQHCGSVTIERCRGLRDLRRLHRLNVDDTVTIRGNRAISSWTLKELAARMRANGFAGKFKIGEEIPIPKVGEKLEPATPIAVGTPIEPKDIPKADWGFFVYLDGDNNLDMFGYHDVNEMEALGSIEGKINFFALVDTAGDPKADPSWPKKTKLFYVQRDPDKSDTIVSREIAVPPESALGQMLSAKQGETNMGDPALLRESVAFLQKEVPSEHFLVDLWNHGNSWHGVCYDDQANDHINPATELQQALQGLPVDIFSSDSCLMATKEVAQVAANLGVQYLVGSEEVEPGAGWDYVDVMQRLSKLFEAGEPVTPEAVARAIVDSYGTDKENPTLSATDLAKFQQVRTQTDALADVLVKAGGLANNAAIKQCYKDALRFEDSDQMDLGDFCRKLVQTFPDGELKEAASALLATMKDACYIETGDSSPMNKYLRATGLSVYAPRGAFDKAYANEGAPWRDSHWVGFIQGVRKRPDEGFQVPAWALPLPPV